MKTDASSSMPDAQPRMKTWLRYTIAFGIALILVIAITLYRGFDFALPLYHNAGAIADGCFVSGVLIFGFGLLLRIATTGFFDMLSYGMRSFFNLLIGAFRRPENEPKFYDYKVAKAEKRGKPGYTLVIVGAVLLIFSGIGTWIFMSQAPL